MNPMGNYRSLRPNQKKHPSGLPNDGRGVPDSTGFKTTRWLNLSFSGDLLVVGNLQVFLGVFLDLQKDTIFNTPKWQTSTWRQRQAMKGNHAIFGLLVKVFVRGVFHFGVLKQPSDFGIMAMGKNKTKKATPGRVPKVFGPKNPLGWHFIGSKVTP